MEWNTNKLLEEFLVFIGKVISIPALIAIVVKVAVQLKNKTATKAGIITSLIVGLSTAYLAKDFIGWLTENEGFRTILIAFVAISAEKIMEYLIFKMEVTGWFQKIGNISIEYIRKVLGLNDND